MGRPKKADAMEVLSVRLPKGIVEEVDRYTEKLKDETPLLSISRADTIRYLIMLALRGGQPKKKT